MPTSDTSYFINPFIKHLHKYSYGRLKQNRMDIRQNQILAPVGLEVYVGTDSLQAFYTP